MASLGQNVQAELDFTLITESGKQNRQEKIAPAALGVGEFTAEAGGFSNEGKESLAQRQ
jgi:hypothetical protein